MALQFTYTQQESLANGIKTLVYSASGVGKTVLTATTPGPVIISAEGGLLSLAQANLERIFGVGRPGISYNTPVIKVSSMSDLQDALRWCTTSHEARAFHTVNLDSVSEIAEVILATERAKSKDPRQAYGGLLTEMMRIVKGFRDIQGKNVVLLAKQELIQDYGGINKVVPSFPGKALVNEMPYFFDAVFYYGIARDQENKPVRYLLTQPQPNYDAKDRSGALSVTEPPDLIHVFRKMLGV